MTQQPRAEIHRLADVIVLAMHSMPAEARAPYLVAMADSFAHRCVACMEQPDWDEAMRKRHLLHCASLLGEAVHHRLESMKTTGGNTMGNA
jgi:hypothetical protein